MKIFVEKLEDRFIKIWQEIQQIQEEFQCFLDTSKSEALRLIELITTQDQAFWFDLRRKYGLLSMVSIRINPETWQVFEVDNTNKTEVQVVTKISNDLITRRKETERLKDRFKTLSATLVSYDTGLKAKIKLFWQAVETYYNLTGKSFSLNEDDWSIYETEESLVMKNSEQIATPPPGVTWN